MNMTLRQFFILITLILILGVAGCGQKGPLMVTMETSKGDIVVELTPDQTPATVENFLAYVRDGFYDGTIFHRVIPRFMIQGGGFDESLMRKSTRDPIPNESSEERPNKRGTIAMARTNDPDSATSQFYINVIDNNYLDPMGYTVFGKVIEGMEVVDAIAAIETTNAGGQFPNLPVETVVIRTIREGR